MIKVIFLDFDGIVVESTGIKTEAFARLFASEGEEAARKIVEYHMQNSGVSRYEKFRFIYKEILGRPLNEAESLSLGETFSRFVKDEVVQAPYVKGALEFIKKNSSKYKFFIISATPQEEIEEIIAKRGINRFFKAIYGSPKEKIEAVREALRIEGIGAQSAVYVGDALSDFWAADSNNVKFIARIHDNENIFQDIDCLKVKDLRGIEAILANL